MNTLGHFINNHFTNISFLDLLSKKNGKRINFFVLLWEGVYGTTC
jgi:hypothetical protein